MRRKRSKKEKDKEREGEKTGAEKPEAEEPRPKAAPPPKKRKRKLVRRLKLLLFSLAALGGVLFLARFVVLPRVVEASAQELLKYRIRGDLSVGEVWFDLRGKVFFFNVEFNEPADLGGGEFLRADRVTVILNGIPPFEKEVHVESVVVEGAGLFVEMDSDGVWNFEKMAVVEKPPGPPGGGGAPGGLPRRTLEKIEVLDSRIHATWKISGGEPVEKVLSHFDCMLLPGDDVVSVKGLTGSLYDGRMAGWGKIFLGADRGYEFQVNLESASVEKMVAESPLAGKRIEGKMSGFVDLHRTRESDGRIAGAGWLEVRDGRLYELPVFVSILNVLDLAMPGEAYFDEAKVMFVVDPRGIEFDEMRFMSHAISLVGGGTMKLDGSALDLCFIPRLGRGEVSWLPLIGQPLQVIFDTVKGSLIQVEVRGTFANPRASAVPVTVLTKPIRRFIELFSSEE